MSKVMGKVLAGLFGLGAMALGGGYAEAVPIGANSELSLNGSDTFTATAPSTFAITFVNPSNVGGQSGSFSILPNCTGCATLDNFSNTSTNFTLYNVSEGGVTSDLVAANITSVTITGAGTALEGLDISGSGTLNLTGFDATPGVWTLTTQGPSGPATVTFSNTAVAVPTPEPGGLSFLITGLAFVFGYRWFSRRSMSGAAMG